MITAEYQADITVGGNKQSTQFDALPSKMINRQSGKLTLRHYDAATLPFDISALSGYDFRCVPFESGVTPTTLASGVISYAEEIFTIASASTPATGGTFTITVAEETTSTIAYNATAATIQSALEALPSRSGGDFIVTALGAPNLGEAGSSVQVETSGGFAISFNSSIDTGSLTGNVHTLTTDQEGSNIQNTYTVNWPKDTIPASYAEFPVDRDGAIVFYVALEDSDDFYQSFQRNSIIDDNFVGTGGAIGSTATYVYNPTDNNNWLRYATSAPVTLNDGLDKIVDRNFRDFGAVIDLLATPPGSPSDGDAYLVIATATGAWLSKEDKIAKYSSTLAAWSFSNVHREGDEVLDLDSGDGYRYDGAAWVVAPVSIGANTISDGQLEQVNQNTIKGRVSTGLGDVETLTSSQARTAIGLDQVDNTADVDKTISDDTQDALDLKVDESTVGDAKFNSNKIQGIPISTATPSNGDVYSYNSGANELEPVAPGGGGGTNGGIAFQLNFETDVTSSEPATGGIKFNSATIASVTTIRASATSANGEDINDRLSTIGSGDSFYCRVLNGTTKWIKVSVTSSTLVTTSYDIVCAVVGGTGVLPAAADIMGIDPAIITTGSSTGVATFNGRAGSVVSANTDYDSAIVADSSSAGGPFVFDSLDTLNTNKVETTRSINTGSTLTGGGDLSADRTLDIDLTNANTYTAQQGFSNGSLTDAPSIAWDVEDKQSTFVTLTANRSLANPTNQIAGFTYILIVTQGGTGSKTLSYGANYKFSGGTAPTLTTTAGAVDIITFISDGTDMHGTFSPDSK